MNGHAAMNRIYRLVWSDRWQTWIVAAENARGRGKSSTVVGAQVEVAGATPQGKRASWPDPWRAGVDSWRVRILAAAMLALGATSALAGPPPAAGLSGPSAVAVAPATNQLPTGSNVVAGQAAVSQSGARMDVTQTSNVAIINWDTFNVGAAAQVNYNQPSAAASTLNRVLDTQGSQILGKITSNGQVFLINPNGVYFGKSASVDAGAFVASANDVGNADFMAGNIKMTRNGASGSVVNEGTLRAALGGYIGLFAPEVRNAGLIVAQLGTVALASGESVTLKFDGHHGLADIVVGASRIKALVDNRGAVLAPGGIIILSALSLDKLQGGIVRNSGQLEATGMALRGGKIVLEASDLIDNSGSIRADAGVDGSPAGRITLSAPLVLNSGLISASAAPAGVADLALGAGAISISANQFAQSAAGKLDVSALGQGGAVNINTTGDVTLGGRVDARSAQGAGGSIEVASNANVTIDSAQLDASGASRGGRIQLQGGQPAPLPGQPNNVPPTVAILGNSVLRSRSSRGQGGSVTLTGERVGLFDSTLVDVSGATGGGSVLVGGDAHGSNPNVADASATYVGADVRIAADATDSGQGGKVIVWSNDVTNYQGAISAQGGAAGGDGGFVEVSSKGQLNFQGTVSTLAPQGQAGTLLLDPYNLTISAASDLNTSGAFDASGTGSILNVTTLQNQLAGGNVTVTTGGGGAEAGNITVANTVGWFSSYSLALTAANNIAVSSGVAIISAGSGNIALTATAGSITNDGLVRTDGGNVTATALGTIAGSGYYVVSGTSSFASSAGNVSLGSTSNKFTGAVSASSVSSGSITLANAQALALGTVAGGSGGVTLSTTSGSNASISQSSGTFSSSGNVSLTADGSGGISIPAISGAATFTSVVAGGAITLGNNSTGALTFNSAGGNVITGSVSAGGQASGTVTIKGSSIALDDPILTSGGNVNLTATSGAVTTVSGANITTTAATDTGTASGSVTVTAANGLTLQNITTTGAANSLGVGSNAAAVTLTATTGDLNVGAITTSGGAATSGGTTNRNGGNAGNIVLGATAGTIYLNGDLNAIGGTPQGTATQGLGGYIDVVNKAVLTANRIVSSGATSGDIDFQSTLDSDATPRSLTVTGGTGAVTFWGAVGATAPLSTLSVSSSSTTTVDGNVTTNAAGGVAVNATSIYLGNNNVGNGSGAITINTLAGNGTVALNSINTWLQDAVTFTRGSGAINFSQYLYSTSGERNNLTFNGSGGGAVTVGVDVGGTSSGAATALGDILVSTGTDLSLGRYITAKSLVALNNTGQLSLGTSSASSWFDGASGFQVATAGSANNYANDQNIALTNNVTLSNATAPLSVSAPNGTISAYTYTALTTAGGALTLAAGQALTLPSNGTLTSNGGTISLSGAGVSQGISDTVNAGSGKIRVNGGGGTVTLDGLLSTTDADSGGTPAILINNANGSNAVEVRSVTATTGTLQVGQFGTSTSLATAQSLGGAGSLALSVNTSFFAPTRVTLTGTGNSAAVSFTVTGTDVNGNAASQTITGPNNGTVTTTQYFSTVTGISTNAATVGAVSAGAAVEGQAVVGSLNQYAPGGYTNAINIHTLSAAATNAISITSTSNTIDQLGNFSVGSSLNVQAIGRTTGMALTGNVAATDVTIATGNGPLALGNYNITSTTGNVWLQGKGLTQSSGSTITSAGTVKIYGGDYQSGTNAAVTLAGAIVAANTSSTAVWIDEATSVQLGNVTAGTSGARGGLQLGADAYYSNGSYAQYGVISGAITQTAGTSLTIGQFGAYQTSGSITLTNTGNEIANIGSYTLYRGGAISIYDADTAGNGLTLSGDFAQGNWGNAVTIETTGALNLANRVYGTGIILSGSSVLDNGNTLYSNTGIELRPHAGAVTLTGSTYVNGSSNSLLIRNASNVQLGYLQSSGTLTFGASGSAAAVAASQTKLGAGNLTLVGGSSTFSTAARVAVASAGDDSGVSFTVTGTDMFGRAQSEVITGANATAATGSKYFATVTQVSASASTASTITVGTATENVSGNVTQSNYINGTTSISGVVGGTVTLTNSNNSFQQIGNLTSGGNLALYSTNSPLTVSGAAVSTAGNVSISSGYGLTVTSAGSVSANASTKGVTLTDGSIAGGYATTIQGTVSADTGGIVISSGGAFSNNATGTLTSTGGVAVKTTWGGTNSYNLTLGGNVTAGVNGIKLTSSGTINQTAGILSTSGTLSGPDQSGGGSPNASYPSARGAITLNDANLIGSLGPFYLYNAAGAALSVTDTSGGMTLAGTIENSHGAITLATAGGALNLATYGVYAGELASGGSNVSLTGQGVTQASGTISATGSSDNTTPRNGTSGGTIMITGYDGSASGTISLGGTVQTNSTSTSAVTIRGTSALVLPNISAPNGSLNVGDTSQAYYHITGPITQTASTALNVKTLNVSADSSAVLANTGNLIGQLGNISVGDNGLVQYDLDVYNSANGLSLTHDITSAGGVRIVTAQGAGSSGTLALGSYNVYATGDVDLVGLGVTQGSASAINANHAGAAGSGGNITVDGGGGTNNITLSGSVTTDGAAKTISIVDATNAIVNTVSAVAGTVALGTGGLPLTGTVSEVNASSLVSAGTLTGNAGVVTLAYSRIDNLGPFTTTGALTLKDQGGAGTAGMALTGNVAVGAGSDIETSDGLLSLGGYNINATGFDLVLKGVGVSQSASSTVNSTTAEIYGGSGNIALFSALNDFTGQVTANSTGSQVSIQDANQLSMNALTGKLAATTSISAWAGTNLVLTPESLTTTTGNIDFRSLNGNLSTPGNLTTGAGNVTLIAGGTASNGNVQVNNLIATGAGNVTVQAATQANLSNSITSTSGNLSVTGATVIHSTGSPGSPLKLQTAGAGTITVDASGTGGFVMGQYFSYQTGAGAISITSGGTADLANISSTSGDVTVNAAGTVQQGAGSAITGNALTVVASKNGNITVANANDNVGFVTLRALDVAGTGSGSGTITYNDLDGVAVRQIQTAGNATLTAGGAITTDSSGGTGIVLANALLVKTLNNSGADILLTAAGNDIATLSAQALNAAGGAIAGSTASSGTGWIRYTDSNALVVSSVETLGSTVLTASGAVTQTGAIQSAKLGLMGSGSFTLNAADVGTGQPINKFSTFASSASGAVNVSDQLALTIGTVNPTGVTTGGAAFTLTAPSIALTEAIDTRSGSAGTAGGAVTLTTTGLTSAGNLVSSGNGSINTSGTAGTGSNIDGGAAGQITLTAAGDSLTVGTAIAARGGAGDAGKVAGIDGTVKLLATAGAVNQAAGTGGINAGKLEVSALNTSALLDTSNASSQLAAKVAGIGQDFSYRSGTSFAIGGGDAGIPGITTQGGKVDLNAGPVTITVNEAISTRGGLITATGVTGFDSSSVQLSTMGDITYAAGAYQNGASVTITSSNGNVTTGTVIADGSAGAGAAAAGAVTLTASNGTLTVGGTTARGVGTGSGAAVQLTGASVHIAGGIDTSGGATGTPAGGNITVSGPAVIQGGARSLSTGAGSGNIAFTSTLNGDGTARDLTLTAGTGSITLGGAVGGSSALNNFNIVSANDVSAAAVTAQALTQQAGTGTTTLGGAVTLVNGLGFIGNNLSVNAPVNAGGTAIISNAGLFTTAAAGAITAAGGLTQNGAGANQLAGNISTTNTNISFATPVTLTGDVSMSTDTGAGNIVFSDTLNSDTTPRNLTLSSGTGAVTLTGVVGAVHALGDLLVNSSGTTTFAAAITAATVTTDAPGTVQVNGGSVSTTGAQTYNDALTLGNNTVLTGTTVTTKGTLAGASHSLKVTGNAVFGDAAADAVTGLTTLEVTGSTTLNTDTVTSTYGQTYTGPVTLGANAVLTGTDVSFASTLNGAHDLTVNASGATTFSGAVGANSALTSLTTDAAGSTAINGGSVITTGTQSYGDNLTLGGNTVLSGSSVTTGGTVAGTAHSLGISGDAVFGNGTSDALTGLTTLSVSGTTAIHTATITSSGAQTYSGAVTLGADSTLSAVGVSFSSTVDSDTTPRKLSVNAGSGAIAFNGAVGATHPLDTLFLSTTKTGTNAITQTAAIHVTKLGIQSAGEVLLNNPGNAITTLAASLANGAPLTLVDSTGLAIGSVTSADGTVTILGLVDGAGTSAVSLTTSGAVTQTSGAVIVLNGTLSIDTTAYNAGNVSVTNAASGGTLLGNTLVGGDFTLDSTAAITQVVNANPGDTPNVDAWLRVGGNFNTAHGQLISGTHSTNYFGGGASAGASANVINLNGVITLSMSGSDLVASVNNGTTIVNNAGTITAATLAGATPISIISGAGGQSISAVGNTSAVDLTQANHIGGALKITTAGNYTNSGTANATGIIESGALALPHDVSFTVQSSAANATSVVTGHGALVLGDAGNSFVGTVSASAPGMNVQLADSAALKLGNVAGAQVLLDLAAGASQTGGYISANELVIRGTGPVNLGQANLVNSVAANVSGGALSLNFAGTQTTPTGGTVQVASITPFDLGSDVVGLTSASQTIAVSSAVGLGLATAVNSGTASTTLTATGGELLQLSNDASGGATGLILDQTALNQITAGSSHFATTGGGDIYLSGVSLGSGAGPVVLTGSHDINFATGGSAAAVNFAKGVNASATGNLNVGVLSAGATPTIVATAGNIALSGAAVSLSSLTASAGSVSVTGPASFTSATISTSGDQTYAGPVTLQDGTHTFGLGTGGNITFSNTVDGAHSGLANLIVNTVYSGGNGYKTFGGAVGASVPLLSVTTNAAGWTTVSGGGVTTTGNQTYQDTVFAGANMVLDAGSGNINAFRIYSPSNSPFDVTLNSSGTVALGEYIGGWAGGPYLLKSFSVTGGAISLGGVINTSGAQSYTGPVTLGADTTLTGVGLTLGSAVDGAYALVLHGGAGDVTLSGAVGSTTPLASITATGVNLSLHDVKTTGTQTYSGASTTHSSYVSDGAAIDFAGNVALANAMTVDTTNSGANAAGAAVTFGGTVDNASGVAQSVSIAAGSGGVVSVNGAVGSGIHGAVGAFAISTAATANLGNVNATSIALGGVGATNLNGALTASGSVTTGTLHAQGTSDSVNGGTVSTGNIVIADGDTLTLHGTTIGTGSIAGTAAGTASNLVINATGAVTVGAVGTDIGTLSVTQSGGTTFTATVSADTVTLTDTTGTVAFDGALTANSLNTANMPYGLSLLGGATISNATTLQNTGTITLGQGSTSVESFTGGLNVSGPATVHLAGTVQTTDQPITFASSTAITLDTDTTLSSGTAALAMNGAINGAHALNLNSQGLTTLGGLVGGSSPLTSLTTDAGGSTTIGGAALSFSGALTFNDAVTLSQSTSLSAGSLTTASTLSAGAHDLAIHTDALALGGTVSGSGHLSLTEKTAGTTIGVAGGAGALNIDAAQWAAIATGFTDVTVGDAAAGALTVGGASVALPNATILRSGAGVAVPADVQIGGAFLRIDAAAASSLTGVASGTGNLETIGAGALTLNAAAPNTYAGQTIIGNGATLDVVADGALASTSGVRNSGTLDLSASNGVNTRTVTGTGDVKLGARTLALSAADGSITGIVSGTGGSLVLDGGALTLGGNNSYSGATLVNGGTLTVTNSSGLGSAASGTTVASGAELILSGGTLTIADALTLNGAGASGAGALINQGGNNTLTGAVTLGSGAVLIAANAGNMTFSGAIDGPADLSVHSQNAVTFQAAIGATTPLNSLTTDAGGTLSLRSVTTTGAQSYGENATLNGLYQTSNAGVSLNATSTLAGDASITAGSGPVSFTGAVDGAHALVVNSSGATSFAANVGATTPLTSVTTDAGGTVSLKSVTTTGAQSYGENATLNGLYQTSNAGVSLNATATLAGDTTVTAGSGAVSFSGSVDGAHALTVNSSGATLFAAAVGSATPLTSLTTNAGGTTAINGGAVTTSGAQSYNDALTLGADTVLAGSNVTMAGTVNGAHALSVNASGVTTFGAAVGAVAALTSLSTDAPGSTTINAGTVTTTGAQAFNDNLSLTSNTVLSATTVSTGGTVLGNTHSLGITGNAVFGNQTSDTLSGLTTLGVSGTTSLNASAVTSTGTQTYTGAVTLGADATVTAGTGAVNFGAAVDGPHALTVNSSGATSFAADVGSATPLTSLSTDAVGTVSLKNVTTTGTQSYGENATLNGSYSTTNAPISLGGTTTLAGDTTVTAGSGSVSFTGTVDGAHALTVNSSGATAFAANVGASVALTSLTTDALGTVSARSVRTSGAQSYGENATLNGSYITTNAPISVGGTTTLAGDTTVTAGSGPVTFTGTVDGAHALIVNSSGATQFAANVGASAALSALTTDAGGTLDMHSVTTSGAQSYGESATTHSSYRSQGAVIAFNGDVTALGELLVDTTLNGAAGANVTFAGGLSSAASQRFGATLTAGTGSVNAVGVINMGAVDIISAAGASLNNAGNSIDSLTGAFGSGGLSARNASTLTVAPGGIASSGNVDLRALSGDVVLDGSVSASGTANILLDAAAGNFTNHVGAAALTKGSGRWLVYSSDPRNDLRAGLAPQFKVYNANVNSTLPGATAGKDGFIYTVAPVITPTLVGTVQKVYDAGVSATLAPGNYSTSTGTIDGDVITLNNPGSGSYDTKGVGTAKTVTVSGLSIASQSNGAATVYGYTLDRTVASANIGVVTQAPLTVVGMVALNNVYDGTSNVQLSTAAASANGVLGTDHIALVSANGAFDGNNKNVGSNKPVTATSVTLSGADQANYYLIPVAGLHADTNPRTLTVSATGANKVYDATTAATVSVADNALTGDVVNVSYSANFLDKNVGDNKYIGVTGISIAGPDANNYTVNTTAAAFANISRAALTVASTGVNRAYDGTTNASVILSCGAGSSGCAIDTAGSLPSLSLNYGTASFASANAGLGKGVNVAGISISGVDAGNYSLQNTTSSTTADVSGVLISLSGALANNKVYDGGISSTLNLSGASLQGVLSGYAVGIDSTSGTGLFGDKNVGSAKNVTVTNISLTGPNAGGYILQFPTGLTANITPAPISAVSGITASNKTYDGAVAAALNTGAASFGGIVPGDNLTVASASGAFSDKNAGNGKTVTVSGIALSGTDSGNYNLQNSSATTTANITPASLTVSASGVDRAYNGGLVAGVTLLSNMLVGDTLTLSDTAALFADKNVGSGKAVSVSGIAVGGADAGNYSLQNSTATTTANITQASLTVGAAGINKVYDGSLVAGVTLSSNMVAGDTLTLSDTSALFSDKNVGNGKAVSVSGIAVGGADAGNYSLQNTTTTTTANITPASISAVSGITASNKTYDGAVAAALSAGAASFGGMIAGDSLTVTGASGTFSDKNAGNGKTVTVSGMALSGADAGNYSLQNSSATATANITPASLTVKATGIDKGFDGSLVAGVTLTSNKVAGDALTLSDTSALFADANVGTAKPISVAGIAVAGADAGNYVLQNTTATTFANILNLGSIIPPAPTPTPPVSVNTPMAPPSSVFDATLPGGSGSAGTGGSPGGTIGTGGSGTGGGSATSPGGATAGNASAATSSTGAGGVAGGAGNSNSSGTTGGSGSAGTGGGTGASGSGSSADTGTATAVGTAPGVGNGSTVAAGASGGTGGPGAVASAGTGTGSGTATGATTEGAASGASTGSGGTTGATGMTTGTSGASTAAGAGSTAGTGAAEATGGTGSSGAGAASGAAGGNASGAAASSTGSASDATVVAGAPASTAVNAEAITVQLVRMARPSAPGLVVVGVPKEKFSFLFSLPKDVYANHSEMTVGQSTVTLENGATLPSWLQFNPATMSFIATSVPAQGIPIRVAVHIGGERVIVLISRL